MPIVEINGVKLDIDERSAKLKAVESYKIGDKVKVLLKEYSNWKINPGVIVDFDNFENLPTITVAYLTDTYSPELRFAFINSESKDIELSPNDGSVQIDQADVLDKLQKDITAKNAAVDEAIRKYNYFQSKFAVYFDKIEEN